ncbi:hypothetical protein HDA31_005314 [Micromonospora carbonacea subsp. aurantiaca]|nr:hypothetical protein [Micromonospora carbonacea]
MDDRDAAEARRVAADAGEQCPLSPGRPVAAGVTGDGPA